jgi:molybdopterin-guanine dinucleotide biosynthesis protein A
MLTSMFDAEGFILVGGQSSRMGSDKSRLVFGEQTGVEHIAAALHQLTRTVRVVGSRDRADAAGLQNIPDTHERWGALGGIHAALVACGSEWALIAACDLPLVTTELFARLWQVADETEGEVFDAIVPIQPDGRPQPLCAFYRQQSVLPAAKQLIAEGEHKPRALLAKVRTRWVDFRELSDLPGAEDFFLNVNTPADYQRAQDILAQSQNQER